jgi:CubicO group peptidase (beta-lactamase class C family)
MLIDDGKLMPGDRVSKYLPSFANEKSQSITIEQLLTHSAGFPLTHMDKPLSGYSGQQAVVEQIGRLGPKTPPGKFVYSDCDTEALAAVVAKIANEPTEEFLRKRIFEPLQMSDTYCVLGKDRPDRARVSSNHAGSPGLWHKYWDRDEKPLFPFFLGAAAAYSTTQDYAKFLQLWLNRGKLGERRLLSEAAVDRALKPAMEMLTPGSEAPYPTGLNPLRPYYGQHWMVYTDSAAFGKEKSIRAFGHSGSDGTLAIVFPDQDLMAFYFTQSRGGMSVFRFEELLAPLVGLPGPKPLTRLTAEQLKPYLGLYQEEGRGRRVWVSEKKNRLFLELSGGAGALMPHWPNEKGRWEFGEAAAGVAVSFDKSSTGAISSMQLFVNEKLIRRYQHTAPAADLPTVDHVMKLMYEKQGGLHLEKARTLELKGTLSAGATTFESVTLAEGSERAVRRLTSAANSSTTIADGQRSRRKQAGQSVEELHGLHRDEALRINPFLRLQDWRKNYRDVQVVGVDKIGGEEAWVVRMACEHTPPITRYVGAKSGRLLKEDTWTTGKGIGTVPLAVTFADYREVAGVILPFRTTSESRLTGKQVAQLKEVNVNANFAKDAFELSK